MAQSRLVKLVGRYTRHEHGFTRLVLRYSDGSRETAWFDRYGKRWVSPVKR